MEHNFKKSLVFIILTTIIFSSFFGASFGFIAGVAARDESTTVNFIREKIFGQDIEANDGEEQNKIVRVEEESAVIDVVESASPAVVSIIITKDLPVVEQYYNNPFGSDFFRQFFGDDFEGSYPDQSSGSGDTETQEIGGGSGFIVSGDGYVVTNKHVVADEEADYTVVTDDGTQYQAEVLARDTLNDLAILKIEGDNFPTLELGDSSNLKVGQSVIAIGNSLGEFSNTVSTGIISGLYRSITAGGSGIATEELTDVIQTDASINSGNSGGPLLNIDGQVIGINTAMAEGAENIGFAIPINEVKDTIEEVKENGRIIRPWLGIRYIQLNESIAKANKLSVDYGALIARGDSRTDLAVIPGSPADKAGLEENDIILEINGEKITEDNPLAEVVAGLDVGDEVSLKILRDGKEQEVQVVLEEMTD